MPARHVLADGGELGAAVIDGGKVDRAQHAIGDVGRSGDLQEVTAGASGHWGILTMLPMNAPLDPGQVCAGPLFARSARLRKELDAEVMFDAAQPRPLLDRRLDLSDEADRRRCARAAKKRPGRDRHRGGGRHPDPAARRGQLAVRPGGGRGAGHRPHQVSEPGAAGRPGAPARHRAAGHRARYPERPAAQARPVVSGGCLDQRAGHDRRHGGQQLVRLALDRVRQHGAQRARRRRVLADGGERWHFGADGPEARVLWRVHRPATKGLYQREARKSKRASRKCCARSPATTSTISARRTPMPRTCWWAPKARSRIPSAHLKLARLPEHKRARRVPLPEVLHRDGAHAAHRQARAVGGGAGRPHDDRARARHPGVPKTVNAFIKGDPDAILLVEFADETRRPAEGPGAADGRPGPARAAWSRSPTQSCSARSGKCARPASTS